VVLFRSTNVELRNAFVDALAGPAVKGRER
jgi:hypothetical protein